MLADFCVLRSRSERRILAAAYSVLSAKADKNSVIILRSLAVTCWNTTSFTRRTNGVTSRIAASPLGDRRTRTPRRSCTLADFVSRPLPINLPTSVVTCVAEPIDSAKSAFRRLMIAQDTGSAVVGRARADLLARR
jgi:hypothetical protein